MADKTMPPGPDATAQEISDYLTKAAPAEAAAWLKTAGTTYDLDVLEAAWTVVNMDARPEMDEVRTNLSESITTVQDRNEGVREQGRQDKAQEQQRQDAVDTLVEQGVPQTEAERIAESASEGFQLPEIMAKGSGYGGTPSKEEQRNLIEAWNEFYPDQPVTNFQELTTRVSTQQNNPTVQQVIDYGYGGGAEPIIEYRYDFGARELDRGAEGRMGGGASTGLGFGSSSTLGQVTVTADQFANLQKAYGGKFGHKDLKQLAYLANQLGVKDASGNNGWQVMAAIAAGLGFFEVGENAEAAKAKPVQTGSYVVDQAIAAPVRAAQAITARELEMLRKRGLQFKEGLAIYGQNDALAYLHAISPTVASSMANTPVGKPVNPALAKRASQLFLNSGFDQQQLQSMGYFSLGINDYFDYQSANAAASAPSGPVRQVPDSDAIRQNAKDLWVQLYASEPTDAQLDKIVSATTSAIMSADIDSSDGMVQDVNANAQIRKQVEGAPEYQDLYGNKPGGMSESEYQQQFRAGAGSILGNQAADPSAIRSGMRTGQYQTSVGAAAVSSQALDNSTWLGRLAGAAQVLNANT